MCAFFCNIAEQKLNIHKTYLVMKHFVLALVAAATLCTPAAAQTQNRVKNLYASSAKLNLELLQSTEQTVQLNRYLFAGYNTLCLPMSLTAEQLGAAASDIRIERLAAIAQEGNVLNLYFVDCTSEGLQAGMPYLIFSPKAQYLRVKNTDNEGFDTDAQTIRMTDNQGNQVAFGSSWETIRKDGRYGIPAKQNVEVLESVLIRTEADKAFLPTRCGFSWEQQSATASELKIQHVSSLAALETTGIRSVGANAIVDVYDLKGNLVKKQAVRGNLGLPRGIYIIGGEKVTVQ